MRHHLTPTRGITVNKKEASFGEALAKLEASYAASGNVKRRSRRGTCLAVPQKAKRRINVWPSGSALVYTQRIESRGSNGYASVHRSITGNSQKVRTSPTSTNR